MAEPDALMDAWQRCRAARPEVVVAFDAFHAYVAARRPPDTTEADQVATWCLEDLYLACACVAKDPAAIRAIEDEIIPIIDAALGSWDPSVVDETRQQLRAALLVDHAGRGPLLAQYNGRGALRRWIRVVAAREAGKIRRADTAAILVDDDTLFDVLAPPGDPAMSAIKREGVIAFKAAFKTAIAQLEPRERTALRLHVLDGLTIDDIAPTYGVHRATVARWIASAKRDLLDRTRRHMMRELRLSGSEVDSLIRLVQSRIDCADESLLRSNR